MLYAQVLMAFEWAVNDALASGEPAVVTLSLGGEYSEFLNKGTARVAQYGIPVVVAAGNDGSNACQASPASTPAAITVGGVDEEDAYADYSNNGPCVDLFAPGSAITAAYPLRNRTTHAGTISLKNLRRVAKELGENMTDDELQEVIDFCDKDGRGEILLDDFCNVLLAAQAQQQQVAADSAAGR